MLTSKNTKKNEDEKSFEKIQFFTRILMILHLCQIWSKSEFCQKDIQTAFSFLFSSVLIATRWLNNSNAYNLHLLSTAYSRERKIFFEESFLQYRIGKQYISLLSSGDPLK